MWCVKKQCECGEYESEDVKYGTLLRDKVQPSLSEVVTNKGKIKPERTQKRRKEAMGSV